MLLCLFGLSIMLLTLLLFFTAIMNAYTCNQGNTTIYLMYAHARICSTIKGIEKCKFSYNLAMVEAINYILPCFCSFNICSIQLNCNWWVNCACWNFWWEATPLTTFFIWLNMVLVMIVRLFSMVILPFLVPCTQKLSFHANEQLYVG